MNKLFLYTLLALLFTPVCDAHAKGENSHTQAHALMQRFFDANETPGLAVSVGLGGKIVWSEGFGYADIEQSVPVEPDRTLFRIGSTIKPMTAFAVAQLVETGNLDLDAPVQAYVPNFPLKRWPITTRQLLGHLAGVRHYEGEEFFSREMYVTVNAGLVVFQDDPLLNQPGDAFVYSSYGYNLVGAVIEGASGKEYLAYMAADVFEPLGMTSTVPDFLERIIPGRGRYYYRRQGSVFNAPEVDNSYKWASGGFIGTSDDLVRFGLAQLDSQRIGSETREIFWTEQTTRSGEKTQYGLGWKIQTDQLGRRWIGHSGGSVGGSTQFWINPEHGLVIAMISNLSEFEFGAVWAALGDVFLQSTP